MHTPEEWVSMIAEKQSSVAAEKENEIYSKYYDSIGATPTDMSGMKLSDLVRNILDMFIQFLRFLFT